MDAFPELKELSDLLTNMCEKRATREEMARAIQFSMDALHFNKSYVENNIYELQQKYGNEER